MAIENTVLQRLRTSECEFIKGTIGERTSRVIRNGMGNNSTQEHNSHGTPHKVFLFSYHESQKKTGCNAVKSAT
jgi:hypothetical protein